jgi:hypothetical protein
MTQTTLTTMIVELSDGNTDDNDADEPQLPAPRT